MPNINVNWIFIIKSNFLGWGFFFWLLNVSNCYFKLDLSPCLYTDQIPFPVWWSLPESHCCFMLSQLDTGQLYCYSEQQVIVSENSWTRCLSHPKAASHLCQILLQRNSGAGLLGHECQKEGPTQVYQRASKMYQVQCCLPDPSLSSGQGFPKPKDSWLCITSFKIQHALLSHWERGKHDEYLPR